MLINNPSGKDLAEIDEDMAAVRVGRRIRKYRILQGLSQAQL